MLNPEQLDKVIAALKNNEKEKKALHIGTKAKLEEFLGCKLKIPEDFNLKEYLYLLTHSKGLCAICNAPTKFRQYSTGYNKTCGRSKCIGELNKRICFQKYGVINQFQRPEIKEKSKVTKLNRYGNETYSGNRHDIASKIDYHARGVKIKQTCLKKYGYKNILLVPEIQKQIKKTCLKKYGANSILGSAQYREKWAQTRFAETGMWHHSQYKMKNLENLNEEYVRDNFVKNGKFLNIECGTYFNMTSFSNLKPLKKRFNIVEENLHKKTFVEDKINLMFDNVFEVRTRSFIPPLEIDLLSRDHNFGIEFNGLLWHSFGKSEHDMFDTHRSESKKKNNHLIKTELVENKSFQLLHIFDNEWTTPHTKEIWVSIINGHLNNHTEINTASCIIKNVCKKTASNFLKFNHLQGSCYNDVRLGLYNNGKLVHLMTFKTLNEHDYILNRTCSLNNITILGNIKLIEYFKKIYNPKTIIAYADRRWDNGSTYEKLGFKFVENTDPNHYYFKLNSGIIFNESHAKKIKHVNPELTITENMYNNGYRKIYDCGSKYYKKEYE